MMFEPLKNETRSPVLSIVNTTKPLDGLAAVRDISFEGNQTENLGLMDPNRVGKSTLLIFIDGEFMLDLGMIRFNGDKITGLGPHKICHLEIVGDRENLSDSQALL
jgi:branched-chain amino acid transport system ATP-binding protein